jgi:hypothetical protein
VSAARERFKASLLRAIPIAAGVTLGWLLWDPPAALRALGAGMYFIIAPLAVVVLLAVTGLVIAANLPKELAVRPAPEAVLRREFVDLRERYQALGFRQVGPVLRVGISPTGLVAVFLHPEEPIFGTVLQPETVGSRPVFDFVSALEHEGAALTSAENPSTALLPAKRGALRQIFPRASAHAVLQRHREALAYLRERGIGVRAMAEDDLVPALQRALAEQRAAFLSSPLRGTLTVLWRTLTKRTPERGPLSEQRQVETKLAGLRGA